MNVLNKELFDVLNGLKPYQYSETFLADLEHMDPALFKCKRIEQVVTDIRELEELGYVKSYKGDGFTSPHVFLTSDGRCYKQLLRNYRLNTSLKWIGNLLTGASGGLVVYLLAQLL